MLDVYKQCFLVREALVGFDPVPTYEMGTPYDARDRPGMINSQPPNGEYNTKNYNDGINAKRIRSNLWPGGKFNDKDGPLSALQNSDNSMRSMSKNLSTNQTVMTLYINIPRLIVPVLIPHLVEPRNIPLAKCIGSGDVVFQLRYNDVMLQNGNATQVTNRYMPDLVYCANLATVNYLVFGIQVVLSNAYHIGMSNNCRTQVDFFTHWTAYQLLCSRPSQITANMAHKKWYNFVNVITTNDFGHIMKNCFWSSFSATVDLDRDTDLQKKTAFLQYMDDFVWDFVNTYAKIGGIFIGSDNQGGAQYGDPNPASYAPTDYVGVLQVAGKNFKVRNMWSACQGGTSSGDILGFKLKHFQVEEQNISPIVFRLSSNAGTQCEQTVNIPANLLALGGYSLLVPSKKQRDTVRASHKTMGHAQERDNGFLQFGICDQISKPSNIFNNSLASACDATASVVPAPFQIYMRLGFTRLPKQYLNATKIMHPAPPVPPLSDGRAGGLPPQPPGGLPPQPPGGLPPQPAVGLPPQPPGTMPLPPPPALPIVDDDVEGGEGGEGDEGDGSGGGPHLQGADANVVEQPDRGNAATNGRDAKKKRVRKEVTMDPAGP